MNHTRTSFTLPHGWVNEFAARQRTLQQWWGQLPTGLRSPVWQAMLASLVILGMLLAFHEVVHGAVQQGELRNKATALHADATWRCKILPGPGARDSCLLQLSALVNASTVLASQNVQLASQ